MTCIVGLKHDGKVYIGGDSLGSDRSFNKVVRSDEKVFKSGEMIFGFTTSFRMGQILQYSFNAPQRPENISDMQYLVKHFIPALLDTFNKEKFGKHNGDMGAEGGTFLMGYRGELYNIESDYQVGKSFIEYDACGCGHAYSKGAFSVMMSEKMLDNPKYSPEKVVELALNAATYHSAGVAGPYTILSI